MADEIIADIDLTEWRAFLRKISSSGKGVTKILRAVFGTFGFKDINDHFRNEEGPEGQWSKRKASTQQMYSDIASGRRKPPKGMAMGTFSPSNKLLQLTGNLRQSILPTNVKNVTSDSIMVFSNSPYGASHQDGDRSRGLVARPFMWLADSTLNKMAQTSLDLWLQGGTGALD